MEFYQQSCVGISIATFENDGWDDICVNGLGSNHLFNNGGLSFYDVTQSLHVEDKNNSQVPAWVDVNNDGLLDTLKGGRNSGYKRHKNTITIGQK